jgi:DNA topoisomerase-1
MTSTYHRMTFTKKLVIVESPTKCKKIETFLGSGYKVMATCGHLRELKSLEQINFINPIYSIIDRKRKIIDLIKKEIDKSEEVILATDDDREGEAIAWHICDIFSLSLTETKRIKFSEITEDSIQLSIRNPERINMSLVYSQQARQILDLMIGFTISPLLWKKYDSKLSAGRCQTPALKLIYDHMKLTEDQKYKMVYSIVGYFTKLFISFDLNKQYETKEEVSIFLEQSYIHQHCIIFSVNNRITKNPPNPLTTSRILQISPYSTKDTMRILQELYEEGYITYIRTDSQSYSQEFLSIVENFIVKEYNNKEYVGNCKPSNNKTHEPIRPTNINIKDLINIDTKNRKIYKIIWEITVQSCMSSSIYDSLTVHISAPFDLKYIKNVKKLVFHGWEILSGYKDEEKEYNYLILLKNNSYLPYQKIVCKNTFIEGIPHYTESSLIKKLEMSGIGRPSTFSSLIEKIQERKYVIKTNINHPKIDCTDYEMTENKIQEIKLQKEYPSEKNRLVIQPIGVQVIDFLFEDYSHLFEYEYTREMENNLDKIVLGESSLKNVCEECYQNIKHIYNKEELTENPKIIRVINNSLSIRKSKNGDYLFYKSPKMKKPKFYNLHDFNEDYKNCLLDNLLFWAKNKIK